MPGLSRRALLGLLAVVLILGANLAVAAQAYRYFAALRRVKAGSLELVRRSEELEQKLRAAQADQEKSQADVKNLTVDRDNVLAQLKMAREQKDEATQERNLFERVLKQTAQEHREMKGHLAPLEEERDELRRLYEDAAKERELLEAELGKLRQPDQHPVQAKATKPDRKGEAEAKRLKDELAKEKQELRKSAQALQEAQERLKERRSVDVKAQEKLAKLQSQYDDLQEHYTALMAKNKTLEHRADQMPTDVTRLAQQHQRLLKETADMHYNLGVLFSKNKQFYQAAAEFRKVLEMRPDDSEAYYNLGVIYAEHLPDQEQAVTYFRKFLAISPHSRDASWVKKYIATSQAWDAKDNLE
ncbi:MAG: hypothetical protein HYZ91_05040 [Candidatus Omnitrophica bacterium]|nr:hypothetical protein [Candidatus Omnitrophota bacterium]